MSLHVPYRSFNRSQASRINGNKLNPTSSVFLNINAPRVQRDLAKHTSIGSVHSTGLPVGFTSDGYLNDGLVVSKTAGSLTLSITAGTVTRASGTVVSVPADTVAITTGASNPRIDVVAVDTATPDIVKVDGTATANGSIYNRLGLTPDLAANRIPIALVYVPGGSVTNLDTATIIPLR